MEKLIIAETSRSPKINFDPDSGLLQLRGKSIMESPEEFYQPVMDWLDKYQPPAGLQVVARLLFYYYNTGSTKQVIEFLKKLEDVSKKSSSMKIIWEYETDDDDAKWDGETMQKMINVPFEIVEIPEE